MIHKKAQHGNELIKENNHHDSIITSDYTRTLSYAKYNPNKTFCLIIQIDLKLIDILFKAW